MPHAQSRAEHSPACLSLAPQHLVASPFGVAGDSGLPSYVVYTPDYLTSHIASGPNSSGYLGSKGSGHVPCAAAAFEGARELESKSARYIGPKGRKEPMQKALYSYSMPCELGSGRL